MILFGTGITNSLLWSSVSEVNSFHSFFRLVENYFTGIIISLFVSSCFHIDMTGSLLCIGKPVRKLAHCLFDRGTNRKLSCTISVIGTLFTL